MMNDDERDLLQDYLDNRLDADQLSELQRRICEDPELAETFVASCIDEAKLVDWAKSERFRSSPQAREELLDEFRRLDEHRESVRRSRRRPLLMTLAIVASSLLAIGGTWWLTRPPAIGRVTAVVNGAEVARSFDWRTIRTDRTMRLQSGVLEVTTARGVVLVLEGPCECHFRSAQEVRLILGRVYAEVPEDARGFSITTPSGTIVDLGTVFGVEVNDDERTEVHVFQGLVTASLDGDDEIVKSLKSGQAAMLDSRRHEIERIALSDKFVRRATSYVEHFAGRSPRAGVNGWIGDEARSRPLQILGDGIEYPGLAGNEGGRLEIGRSGNGRSSTLGRRWHGRFFSMLVYPDDDFPKRLGTAPATLVSFGPLGDVYDANVRLVVSKQDPRDSQSANFGLIVDGVSGYEESKRFRGFKPCLVVVGFDDDQVRLWINPSAETLGARRPPPPSLVVPRTTSQPVETFWINDPLNSTRITWYFIDAIRGGGSWADVTPKQ